MASQSHSYCGSPCDWNVRVKGERSDRRGSNGWEHYFKKKNKVRLYFYYKPRHVRLETGDREFSCKMTFQSVCVCG